MEIFSEKKEEYFMVNAGLKLCALLMICCNSIFFRKAKLWNYFINLFLITFQRV